MRSSILTALLCLAYGICNSQNKLGNEWISGAGGQRIVFKNGNVTTNKDNFIIAYFQAGNSNICDTNGNLILASDGYTVYNSLGAVLDDGDTLVPENLYIAYNGFSTGSQTSIFLPMENSKYYFITPTFSNLRFDDCNSGGDCFLDLLLYNVIDMNANGGQGKVVERMKPLIQNGELRKTQMMACRHGNGKDWWLLKQVGGYADVHTFLFSQDSVYDYGVQQISQPDWGDWDIRGQSAFTLDGTMYATTSHGLNSGKIMLADFDRCEGVLSNHQVLQMPTNSQQNPNNPTATESLSVGLCFSPDKRFLYVASICNVYQYDLQDSTWFHIAGIDTTYLQFTDYDPMYLGPDGKIYIGNFGGTSKQMSRIDNPDVKGAGCNFCPRCLRLDSLGLYGYAFTPPCMPNYGLGAKPCWPLDTPNIDLNSTMIVYPNPATSVITIKNKKGKKKDVYDCVGQKVLSTNKEEINVSSFAKGVYFIMCEGETKKVIIEE